MKDDQHPGIRDRKRLETRSRIEDAAVFLVLRDGLESTTVDAISEMADVSPRTFFNYFESKDRAILGVHQADIGDDLTAEHLGADRDVVDAVVRLLFDVMGATFVSRRTMQADRLEVLRRHPEVLAGQVAKLTERAGRRTEVVRALLSEDPRFTGTDLQLLADADVLLGMCGGAVRAALREWSESDNNSDVEDVQQRAASLVKDLLGKLT